MPELVDQGALLAARFRLNSLRPSDLPHSEQWLAFDETLGRSVWLQIIDGATATRAADGARRAGLLDDPRILPVIEVFEDNDRFLIVTEVISGTRLDDLLVRGPLNPKLARTIAGEAAQALASASARGVHHLGLRPACIYRSDDGNIIISGTGFDGILLGEDATGSKEASRIDAVGLVALIYTMLTGAWPGSPERGGALMVAARGEGGPIPPGEIAASIPNDLDTLCVVTLGPNQDGPHSPWELSDELAPWMTPLETPEPTESARMTLSSVEVGMQESNELEADLVEVSGETETNDGAEPQGAHNSDPGVASEADGTAPASPWAPVAGGNVTGGQRRIRIHSTPKETAGTMSEDPGAKDIATVERPTPSQQPDKEILTANPAALDKFDTGEPTELASEIVPQLDESKEKTPVTSPTKQSPAPKRPAGRDKAGSATPGPQITSSSQDSPASALDGVPRRRSAMDGFSNGGAAHAVASAAARRTPPPAAPARPVRSSTPRTGATGTYPPVYPAQPTPGASSSPPPASAQESSGVDLLQAAGIGSPDDSVRVDEDVTRNRFDPTRIVIIGVCAIVAVIALFTLRSMLNWDFQVPGLGKETVAQQDPTAPESSAPPSAIAGPVTITGVESLDPYGDNNEHPETVAQAIDGDPTSMWSTRFYTQPNFAGKPGVGLRIKFDEPTVVETIAVTSPGNGGRIQIMTDVPDRTGAGNILGEGSFTAPSVVIELTAPETVTSLVIWFPEAPVAPDGKNRVDIAEVAVN